MSVVDVIRRRYEDVTLTRRSGQTITDGIVSDTNQDISVIQAHVQQASKKALENLPEGQRTTDDRVFWTETVLQAADLLTVGGITYKVQTNEDWIAYGEFVIAVGTKVDDTPA